MKYIITIFSLSLLILSSANGETKDNKRFDVIYEWSFINFTWNSADDYNSAITTQSYIPQNNAMTGIKFYKGKVYIALPRICPGAPITLGYIDVDEPATNPLVTPFPDWSSNDISEYTCAKLGNVQSMEIDADGVMWVLNGARSTADTTCPQQLFLYDLNDNGTLVHTYSFPEEVSPSRGGGLNDIVIDDTDGTYAYITDTSGADPGLIVYSKSEDRSWKLRDSSMLGEADASNFVVDGMVSGGLTPIDGIALSPNRGQRYVYYCALTGYSLYSIGTDILKDEELIAGDDWKSNVTLIGQKQAQSDGMVADYKGRLYYGLLPLYGVGKWDTHENFTTSEIVDQNNGTMVWTDSFAFDDKGYIHLLANHINRFFGGGCNLDLTDDVKFRVLRYYTGTKSYLYSY